MSLTRLIIPWAGAPEEGAQIELDRESAHHLSVLRLHPGEALELLLPGGAWRGDLVASGKQGALVRLVRPLEESREAPHCLEACLPLTAQLSLWDEWLPPLVELGVTLFQPVVYARSEYDARRTLARMDRWRRIIQGAVAQSHRSRIPELCDPGPFEILLDRTGGQRWVAYEGPWARPNPRLQGANLAFTSGPEGGIDPREFEALCRAGWQPVTLGRTILRAVTAPVALVGAVQFGWSAHA